ncbi:thiamine pyrophosphate-dependent dehydrogenase E1 component subunit alpha [Caenispirillum salinarum]|uniref:thiamine pyrophosphate-dependent dehydrogenase E1 component subunit alpha n=1 Tax=Caenispirillum salinarum TaxID=859058 RepID=UPI00384D4181
MSRLDPMDALRRMTLIRAYEDMLVTLLSQGRAGGTCTSVGGEASAVGVVSALAPEDLILTNHRSAGHLLARGADPGRLLAEVMGRRDGYCGGFAGSLHVSARALGVVLTSTIVGGELGLCTGVALSRKVLAEPGIVACFFGDGAAAQGRFHESLNLAAVWDLPVLYICENNEWQAYVHRRETMLGDGIAARAAAYGVDSAAVDGCDVAAVFDAAAAAADAVRTTGRPFLLETRGYRLRGHLEPDDQAYVDAAELARWRERDPLRVLRRRLEDAGLAPAELDAVAHEAEARMEAAVAFADASPLPDPAHLLDTVYA